MIELIIKNDIRKDKIDALLVFLKNWDMDVEIRNTPKVEEKEEKEFSLSAGIWEDYNIDATTLRKEAWRI
jgi:hypothetical protein